jgi:DNA repair/transcription protein MET18/MMS19
MSPDLVISKSTQVSLDNMIATLANKYSASDELTDDWTRGMQSLSDGFAMIMRRVINAGHPDVNVTLAKFRTILHFISGFIVNFRSGEGPNWLLRVVCDMAPGEMTIGRQLAQCFEILVSPKEYLGKENHARIKRLHAQWIYRMTVSRYLDRCFPTGPGFTGMHAQDERGATNQAVAVFAILKHIDYHAWQDEAEQIIRVVIRSLTTFGVSKDINNVMGVLLAILEREPELLKQHITALITHILAIYQMARNVEETIKFMDRSKDRFSKGEGALCRKSCLEFLKRVPGAYEGRYLLSQRRAALKALSVACGDPVREVREIAIEGRNSWTALS